MPNPPNFWDYCKEVERSCCVGTNTPDVIDCIWEIRQAFDAGQRPHIVAQLINNMVKAGHKKVTSVYAQDQNISAIEHISAG